MYDDSPVLYFLLKYLGNSSSVSESRNPSLPPKISKVKAEKRNPDIKENFQWTLAKNTQWPILLMMEHVWLL